MLGHNVFVADRVSIDPGFPWLVEIGDDVTIAPDVEIICHDASIKRLVGSSAVGRVWIGAGAYIGARAVILPGVRIGEQAIVGAGSVVREDVPASAVVIGNPAAVVNSVQELGSRHELLLPSRPTYPAEGYSLARGGVPEAHKQRMRADLEHVRGYVE